MNENTKMVIGMILCIIAVGIGVLFLTPVIAHYVHIWWGYWCKGGAC